MVHIIRNNQENFQCTYIPKVSTLESSIYNITDKFVINCPYNGQFYLANELNKAKINKFDCKLKMFCVLHEFGHAHFKHTQYRNRYELCMFEIQASAYALHCIKWNNLNTIEFDKIIRFLFACIDTYTTNNGKVRAIISVKTVEDILLQELLKLENL